MKESSNAGYSDNKANIKKIDKTSFLSEQNKSYIRRTISLHQNTNQAIVKEMKQKSINSSIQLQNNSPLKDSLCIDKIIGNSQNQKAWNQDKVFINESYKERINQMLIQEIQQRQFQKIMMQVQQEDSKQFQGRDYKPYKTKSWDTLFIGIWIGVSVSILILLIVIIKIHDLSITNQSQFSRDFPTWRGIAIFIFYIWVLGLDMHMFQKYHINYRQILRFKQGHYPHIVNIFKIAGVHTSVFLILFLLYVLDLAKIYEIPGFVGQYFALISWSFLIVFIFLPLPIFTHKGRFYVFKLLLDSLLSPFMGVTFPISWVTDQAVSMAVPLKDLAYTVCYYTQLDYSSSQNVCQDSYRFQVVLIVATSICSMRILQCIRQGYDKGQYFMTPFFFNTLKYSATIITAVLAFSYKLGDQRIEAAWIFFAVISSIYSYFWDLRMDWNLLRKNNMHPLLRKTLKFKPVRNYYIIIFSNLIMRWAWIMTISPKLAIFFGNANIVSLVTGMIQIIRRGIWNLLRFQNQHLQNKGKFINNCYNQQKQVQIRLFKFYRKLQNQHKEMKKELTLLKRQSHLFKDKITSKGKVRMTQQKQLRQIQKIMQQVLSIDTELKSKIQLDRKKGLLKRDVIAQFRSKKQQARRI